ncbi:MAG: WYL domain-containing protein [Verrucomicrobiae bacterium]|nr:WYL domain-containing protein [Verrucomicrobiae bacterium]
MPLHHPQHERMTKILRMIQEMDHPNSTDFANACEVDRRTILRDLDYLRDRMHAPIAYDKSRKGYRFTRAYQGMPALEVRESDLLWLFVGQHLLDQASDEELASQVRESFERIAALMDGSVSIAWDRYSGLITSKVSGLGAAELETFQAVSKALTKHRELRFSYRKTGRSALETRHVRPVHSAFVNNQWYLFSFDIERNDIRTFVLSRMSGVEVMDETFDPASLPEIPRLLEKGFGVQWSKTEQTDVRIRISEEIAHLIRERKWHPSQRIEAQEDGSLLLHLRVNTFRELANWICSWGPLVEVLDPPRLRNMVAEKLRDAAAVYQSD